MHSLHRTSGGKQSKRTHMPSESEGFALAIGAALQWAKLRDSSSKAFFTYVPLPRGALCSRSRVLGTARDRSGRLGAGRDARDGGGRV